MSELRKVKLHVHQVDEEHRESRSFLWDVQQANAAMGLQIKKVEQELAIEACPGGSSRGRHPTYNMYIYIYIDIY